jgi:hypothetical protein
VIEHLTHFHNANNRRLNEHFTILLDVLVGDFLFGLLFRLEWEIDVDAEFFAGKFSI